MEIDKILEYFETNRIETLKMLKTLISTLKEQSINVDIILINKESDRFVDVYVISKIFIKNNELFYDCYSSQEDRDDEEIEFYSENMFDVCSMDELYEILINLKKLMYDNK